MAKLILSDLANLQNDQVATQTLNSNFDAIETAIEKTLSRDGTIPNTMEANLDMNSKRILNLPAPASDTEPVRRMDIQLDAILDNLDASNASAAAAAASATAAQTARTGAETARTGAETARTGAQTAETNAETAQAITEIARDQVLALLGDPVLGKTYHYFILDNISSSFNGVTTAFTLKQGGVNFSPLSSAAIMVFLNDAVYQIPGSAYTLSGSTITFTTAPPAGDVCTILALKTIFGLAEEITFVPSGGISAVTVQLAIQELDTEKQPIDSDLTAIAALTPSNDDIIQRKAGAWTNRTLAQLLTDLNLGALYQPLDGDLTSIAALATTAAGRSILTTTDPNADRMMAWDDSAAAITPIALADLTSEGAPAAGDYVLIYGAEGDLRKTNWNLLPGVGGGINNVVEDLTPQLGGDLDANTFNIGFDDNTGITDDSGNQQLIFQKTASAVNQWEMTNASTGTAPILETAGDDANIDAVIRGKGTGKTKIGGTSGLTSDSSGNVTQISSMNGGALSGFRNHILNGAMMVAQQGTSFDSTTTPVNNDDTYLLDQWILLSDGNDVVDVARSTTAPTNGLYSISLDVETANKKFGILQVLEQKNSIGLIGNTVVVSFKAKVSSTTNLDNLKVAIISWDGAADAITSDIISAWNVEGTNPTLVANWTYENTPANLNPTTSFATYSVSEAIDTASTKNIGIFIWSDVTVTSVGSVDILYITDVQLEIGSKATTFERRPYQAEIAMCQTYLEIIGGTVGYPSFSGNASAAQAWTYHLPFKQTKHKVPTVTKNGTWFASNCGQPSFDSISINGARYVVSSSAAGLFYSETNSTDDIIIVDARL